MKVIDLLNKIANSEEAPKKIKYRNSILEFATTNYVNNNTGLVVFGFSIEELNDEVEIIEEDKDIEELVCCMKYEYENDFDNVEKDMKTIVFKINELVREVKKLKGTYE